MKSCWSARRGIRSPERQSLEDLRGARLIAMQEGAGVRQVIDDELREADDFATST
jgi:molybdate-binding protein